MGEVLDYLLSFAPWIGYVVLTRAANSWADGYSIGLGIAFALVAWRTIRRDSRFIDIGTLCFCAVMTAVSVSDPTSPLRPYNLPLSMAAVAALSTASLVMGSPFTFRIARRHVEDDILDDPDRFQTLYKAHVAATSWWAGSQIVAAGASALCVGAHLLGWASVIQAVGTLVPVGMTRYHHGRGTRPVAPVESEKESEAESTSGSDSSGSEREESVVRTGDDRLEGLGEVGQLPS
jgi:hypothetical protein